VISALQSSLHLKWNQDNGSTEGSKEVGFYLPDVAKKYSKAIVLKN
jgi:hypothetical protein